MILSTDPQKNTLRNITDPIGYRFTLFGHGFRVSGSISYGHWLCQMIISDFDNIKTDFSQNPTVSFRVILVKGLWR